MGWLRFNMATGDVDAHCAFHGPGCKLYRKAKKATMGLSMAWLQRGRGRASRDAHAKDKILLSLETAFDERQAARDSLIGLSHIDPLISAIVELETSERGGECAEPAAVHISASKFTIYEALAEDMASQSHGGG